MKIQAGTRIHSCPATEAFPAPLPSRALSGPELFEHTRRTFKDPQVAISLARARVARAAKAMLAKMDGAERLPLSQSERLEDVVV